MAAGCTVGPDYEPPIIEARPDFGGVAGSVDGADYGSGVDADLATWWQSFGDPTLTSLVNRTAAGNLSLQQAAARVVEARYRRAAVAGELVPELTANAAYTRQRISENLGFAAGGTGGATVGGSGGVDAGAGTGAIDDFDLFELGTGASWEIDVFGRLRREVEAADATFEASVEDFRAVFTSLAAETARGYVRVRAFQDRKTVALTNVRAQRRAVDLAQARFDTGLASRLDVAEARALLEQTLATIPDLEDQLQAEKNALAVLLGEKPGTVDDLLAVTYPDASEGGGRDVGDTTARRVPTVPSRLAVGIPADLIRRRPDIRRDERRLAAETARVGARVGDLYPRFVLAGNIGLASSDVENLIDADSLRFGIGPDVSWPLFQGGTLRALVGAQSAVREQALIDYRLTILTALRETADALTGISRQGERLDRLQAAEAAAQEAVSAAEQQYREGLVDFNRVIDAQQTLLDVQDLRVQSQQAAAEATVDLYLALGGGWPVPEAAPDLPAPPPTRPAPDLVPSDPDDLDDQDSAEAL